MEFPQKQVFGALLFRCAEQVANQGRDAYSALGVALDARMNSVVLTLMAHGELSSSELAELIGHSRQMIEAKLKTLVRQAYLVSRPDPQDTRRRLYRLSDDKADEFADVADIMRAYDDVYQALWTEIGVDLEAALEAFDDALRFKSLTTRLCERHPRFRDRSRRAA